RPSPATRRCSCRSRPSTRARPAAAPSRPSPTSADPPARGARRSVSGQTAAVSDGGYSRPGVARPTIAEPPIPEDDGSADPRLCEALTGYAAGRVGVHTVLRRLQGARLLVPIVAVLTEEEDVAPGELRREKSSEMALPTLIGDDGRRGVLGFTCTETMQA